MIKEIAQYIENETGFTIGTDLFVGHRLSTSPDECIVVLENAGGKPDFDLPDKVEKAIQIISRAATYFTARENAYTVYDLLHGKSGITLPIVVGSDEFVAMVIEGMNVPQTIGQDDKSLWEFSTNFIFRMRDA